MPGEKKTKGVSITVTPTDRAMVDQMAALEYRSMAGMMRILIHEGFATRKLTLKAEASDGSTG